MLSLAAAGVLPCVPLVPIGNSRGLRIPKPLLEASGLVDEVEITIEPGRLIVTPVRHARAGWEGAFAGAESDDELAPVTNRFDEEEWTW